MRETKLSLMLGLTFIVLIGVICWAVPVQNVHTPESLPTFREIQQQLRDLGFTEVEVDGRIGPITIRNWDRAICNQE